VASPAKKMFHAPLNVIAKEEHKSEGTFAIDLVFTERAVKQKVSGQV